MKVVPPQVDVYLMREIVDEHSRMGRGRKHNATQKGVVSIGETRFCPPAATEKRSYERSILLERAARDALSCGANRAGTCGSGDRRTFCLGVGEARGRGQLRRGLRQAAASRHQVSLKFERGFRR